LEASANSVGYRPSRLDHHGLESNG
jgi:hypothetical protein